MRCALALFAALGALLAAEAQADAALALEAARSRYPGTEIRAAEPTDLPGIYRYDMGGETVYGDASGRYLFLGGVLVDMDQGPLPPLVDFNAAASDAVELQAGDKGAVLLFSDPLCPYCLKLEQRIASGELDGFRILLVLAPFLPGSEVIARRILCQADSGAAYRDYMLMHKEPGPCDTDLLDLHIRAARNAGIDATPTLLAPSGALMRGLPATSELRSWIASEQGER